MRPAEPLPAAIAILLRVFVAGLLHARDSLTNLLLGLDAGCGHGFLLSTKWIAARKAGQRAGSTTPTLFTPLQAIYTRPSAIAAILRTVPLPDGITALANASVLRSKRTIVFGFTPDSLYDAIPSGNPMG
jgi:hypothetical protein